MQKNQPSNEEIEEIKNTYRVSPITYFIGTTCLAVSLFSLVLNLGWTPLLNPYNVGLATINLLLLVIVFYFYFKSYYIFYKLDDISKTAKGVLLENLDEENVNNSFRVSKQILWYCRNIWVTIIFGWIALYAFILINELGYLGLSEENSNLVLRIFNYVDTTQFLILYSVFSSAHPSLKFKNIVVRYWPVFTLLAFTVLTDLISHSLSSDLEIAFIFTVVGGVLSALAFIMFFARLDSTLLQLNKIMLAILMLYGIFQTLYPILLSNSVQFSMALTISLYLFGLLFGGTAKIYMAILFSSSRFLERFLYYFSSIYFLAPVTKHRLSIGHTFYALKTFDKEDNPYE